jgi:type II secretory pathway pseudopilin PulG
MSAGLHRNFSIFRNRLPSRGGLRKGGRSAAGRVAGRAAGFSLIEGMVAMAVLMTVVIGVIPLFTQSMVNNVSGRQMTQAANYASDGFEMMTQMPFNNELLTLDAGDLGKATLQLYAGREGVDDATGYDLPSNVLLGSHSATVNGSTDPDPESLVSAGLGAGSFSQADVDQAVWLRMIVVRQFRISSLSDGVSQEPDGVLAETEELPGGTTAADVHLKRVDVTVVPRGADGILRQGRITASMLKAF